MHPASHTAIITDSYDYTLIQLTKQLFPANTVPVIDCQGSQRKAVMAW
jgi:hypothetical protein